MGAVEQDLKFDRKGPLDLSGALLISRLVFTAAGSRWPSARAVEAANRGQAINDRSATLKAGGLPAAKAILLAKVANRPAPFNWRAE